MLSPVLGLVSLAVWLDVGRPILFRQKRPGLHERPFTLYKFRSMNALTHPDGRLLPDAERLTPFGQLLRRYSLDELPQLFNILAGHMSLVGPRPLLTRYLPYYTDRERLRHTLRPGLTGWAQVHGRHTLSWDDRLEMDVWYVLHWSLGLDFRILARTLVQSSPEGPPPLPLDEERSVSRDS